MQKGKHQDWDKWGKKNVNKGIKGFKENTFEVLPLN